MRALQLIDLSTRNRYPMISSNELQKFTIRVRINKTLSGWSIDFLRCSRALENACESEFVANLQKHCHDPWTRHVLLLSTLRHPAEQECIDHSAVINITAFAVKAELKPQGVLPCNITRRCYGTSPLFTLRRRTSRPPLETRK